jgi:hypothetical protein
MTDDDWKTAKTGTAEWVMQCSDCGLEITARRIYVEVNDADALDFQHATPVCEIFDAGDNLGQLINAWTAGKFVLKPNGGMS